MIFFKHNSHIWLNSQKDDLPFGNKEISKLGKEMFNGKCIFKIKKKQFVIVIKYF